MPTPQIDTRLKMLSNSSSMLLHTCPRKYQLIKLCGAEREQSMHLSFGSAFGEGLQQLLSGATLQAAVISAVLQWDMDIFAEDFLDKTLWKCIAALESFHYRLHSPIAAILEANDNYDLDELTPNLIGEYEVAYINGKPACEVGFAIELPNGFVYRGYVDIIMRHKATSKYLVVDIKSTISNSSNNAKFQNSPQALGYSIVLDAVAHGQSEFSVLYYEYMTTVKKYVSHYFTLGNLSRAKWLHNLVMDMKSVELYQANGDDYPSHGESCVSFQRTCPFIDTCGISIGSMLGEAWQPDTRPWKELEAETARKTGKHIDVYVTLDELIARQLEVLE